MKIRIVSANLVVRGEQKSECVVLLHDWQAYSVEAAAAYGTKVPI